MIGTIEASDGRTGEPVIVRVIPGMATVALQYRIGNSIELTREQASDLAAALNEWARPGEALKGWLK